MHKYHEHGCQDRAAYLAMLSELHGIPLPLLQTIADRIGPSGDFTILPLAIIDYENEVNTREAYYDWQA